MRGQMSTLYCQHISNVYVSFQIAADDGELNNGFNSVLQPILQPQHFERVPIKAGYRFAQNDKLKSVVVSVRIYLLKFHEFKVSIS